jgi:CO/xanthine dehydrogenase FAD-binding subunit
LRPFDYARPERLDEALALLAEHGPEACVLAGGTDVIVQIREGLRQPRVVVDLKRVRELRTGIVETAAGLRIGALATMSDLARDARVRARFPALVESARVVGSIQIRNRATLAGNICNASPAADTAPALLAYRAVVNVAGAGGARALPVADFFTGPGRTALARGEIVESIDLPFPERGSGAAFGRVTRRRGVDLATINLCCVAMASGAARVACGAAGPRPFVVEGDRDSVVERAVAASSPISDVRGSREYRLAMLGVVGRRTMEAAARRAGDA